MPDPADDDLLFAATADLLAIVGFDGEVKQVDPAWADLLGYDDDELLRTRYTSLFHPDDAPAISEALERMAETGEPAPSFELSLRCKDGSYRWVLGSARPDLERGVLYISARDIDERRKMEAALREAEERFRLAFEHAPVGMAITRLDGTFEQVNGAMCRMLGYSEKELLGSHVDILELDDDPLVLTGPSVSLLTGELDVFRGEFPMRAADGHGVWIDLSLTVSRDAEGLPLSFLAQCIDVSERRRADAEVRLRAELEEVIAEMSAKLIGVERASLESQIRTALGRIAELLGVDRAYVLRMHRDLEDLHFVEWCRPGVTPRRAEIEGLPAEAYRWWGGVLARTEPVRVTHLDELSGDGADVIRGILAAQEVVSMAAVPLSARRGSAGLIGVVTVTAERTFPDEVIALLRLAGESFMSTFDRADADAALADASDELTHRNIELERSNEDLERFAFAAAHDLKAPLGRMEMALQAIGMAVKDLDPERRELLEIARRGAARMRQLIEDLLSYATIGKGLGDPEPVDLADVLHQVVVDLAEQTDGAAAGVIIGELPTVTGHRSLLVQLFQNLVSNAIKFARTDVPTRIEVASEPTSSGWRVTVTDNGIGIDPAKRNEVFGMFTRLAGDDAYPGTGIGLATCQKAVLQHGGRLWVEDGIDGGTRFCVTLPR